MRDDSAFAGEARGVNPQLIVVTELVCGGLSGPRVPLYDPKTYISAPCAALPARRSL